MPSGFREGQAAESYRAVQKCPGQVVGRGKVGKVGSSLEELSCPLALNRTINQEIPRGLEDSRRVSAATGLAWFCQCFPRDRMLRLLPELD